ncbi:hypothetical protein DFR74_1357 [Nocardia puris]|uniref:HNH nuclease domain-containing protein n=1 Tax=Nocardia puris TaxID=208602 RepID=A0A366CTH7_9NOCA|nr:hypothetical protein DFR74_1357 [Nocardia puris]
MWRSEPPQCSVTEIITECVRRSRREGIADRVAEDLTHAQENSEKLQGFIKNGTTWMATPQDFPLARLSKEDMEYLYTERLVGKAASAPRRYYDAIKAVKITQLCPYCNATRVATLDHFLPKANYATLSVDPWNLVPCCSDCNRTLNNFTATRADESPYHPYGEEIPDPMERWLYAEVQRGDPPAVRFYVQPPMDWPDHTGRRVRFLFERFDLQTVYSGCAAQYILESQEAVRRQHEQCANSSIAAASARADRLCAASDVANALRTVNNVRSVIYESLADEEWFCRAEW